MTTPRASSTTTPACSPRSSRARSRSREARWTREADRGHHDLVASVTLSRDGKHSVSGSFDMTAILWKAATGKRLRTLRGHTDGITSVALSGDGKLVLTGSEDHTAILWDAVTGKKRR